MASAFELFVYAVEDRLADTSVLFTESKTAKLHGKRDQARRISFERVAGNVQLKSAPVAIPAGNAPVNMNRFIDRAQLMMSVYAEDEETTFQLFVNVLNAIADIMGPNAFNDQNNYEWAGKDSKGGAHTVRQPCIMFNLEVGFKMPPPALLTAQILTATQTQVLEDPIQ